MMMMMMLAVMMTMMTMKMMMTDCFDANVDADAGDDDGD